MFGSNGSVKYIIKKGEPIRWKDFEKELITRFGSSEYTDYDEALAHIKQMGNLRDYQKEFECLANRVQDWPEKALVGAFMGGLKPELAAEVRMHRPSTYCEAIKFARLQEDHIGAAKNAVAQGARKTENQSVEVKTGAGSWRNRGISQSNSTRS